MIKLFDFQEKEVRTVEIDGEIWFSGKDVFSVLDLTWKGTNDLKSRCISSDCICKRIRTTRGGSQEITFINKEAVALISLQCRKLTISNRNLFFKYLDIQESDLKINRPETIFINSLIPILKGFGVSYFIQYPVGKYKVDIYVPIIGFIEYDEKAHFKGINIEEDAIREKEIQFILNEPFLRCKEGNEDLFLQEIVIRLSVIGVNTLCDGVKKALKENDMTKAFELLNIYEKYKTNRLVKMESNIL